jgi:hypothetical protein
MSRRSLHVVLAFAAAMALPAVSGAQSRTFERTLDLDAGASLTLVSSKGSVRLTPWDQDRIEIHARIDEPDGVSADYARQVVEATRIQVTGDRRALRIAPDYDAVPYEHGFLGSRSRSVPPVQFEIRAPRRLDIRLDVDRSDTRVGAFEGRFDIESDRGDIEADGHNGPLRLRVDRGDHVTLSGLHGELDVVADRSDVRLGVAALSGDSRVEIDRGDLEVRVAAGQGFDLRADIERRADFESDFPITMRGRVGSRIEGSVNGGGPRLAIHSERAPVRLRRR